MKHLFLPPEPSIILKDKGFNERCIAEWRYGGGGGTTFLQFNHCHNGEDILCAAPTYQQVIDWFREKHKIVIWIEVTTYTVNFNYRCYVYTHDDKFEGHREKDYYEALTEAINHAIKLLP